MNRSVWIRKKETFGELFRGLILPEVFQELEKEQVFLIGAIEEDEPVGAAVWRLEENRGCLLSIGVAEEHRRKGIGTALLNCSMKVLHQTDCLGIYTLILKEETAAGELFRSFGMEELEDDSKYYALKLGDIAAAKSMQVGEYHTRALKEVPVGVYASFIQRTYGTEKSRWERALFDPECSRFIIREQSIQAGIFIEKEEQELSVAWLYSQSSRPEDILYLFRDAAKAGLECYGTNDVVSFTCFDEQTQKIAKKLFGEKLEETPLRMWSLFGYKYRLADTGISAWEGGE